LLRSARQNPYGRRLITVALALTLDRLWGEPPAAWHPVVAMGRGIAAMERRAARLSPPAQLAYGAVVALGGSLACAAGAGLVLAATRGYPLLPRTVLHALLLKSCFALRALDDAAAAVAEALRGGDLPLARARLRALVGRDTATLDAPLLAAAAVESVAENLSDSFVAPLTWYWLLDLPGALAYRFANTCDAMLGYRGAATSTSAKPPRASTTCSTGCPRGSRRCCSSSPAPSPAPARAAPGTSCAGTTRARRVPTRAGP
jgi:adenosylcobinamide-phosphate synthase